MTDQPVEAAPASELDAALAALDERNADLQSRRLAAHEAFKEEANSIQAERRTLEQQQALESMSDAEKQAIIEMAAAIGGEG